MARNDPRPHCRRDFSHEIELYESGLSLAQVADEVGVTRQSIHAAFKRRGVKLRAQRRFGEDNHFYRGGEDVCGYPAGRGYIKVLTSDGRKRFKHRVVMEKHLGKPLHPDDDVHHINGDKSDNRIENLRVISHGEHTSLHKKGLI